MLILYWVIFIRAWSSQIELWIYTYLMLCCTSIYVRTLTFGLSCVHNRRTYRWIRYACHLSLPSGPVGISERFVACDPINIFNRSLIRLQMSTRILHTHKFGCITCAGKMSDIRILGTFVIWYRSEKPLGIQSVRRTNAKLLVGI